MKAVGRKELHVTPGQRLTWLPWRVSCGTVSIASTAEPS